MAINFKNHYPVPGYDELISNKGNSRRVASVLCRYFAKLKDEELSELKQAVDMAIKTMGISFTALTVDRK